MLKILLFLFLFSFTINAQDAKSYLKNIQEKFSEINNFSADFKQDASAAFGGENFSVSGKITYEAKNKFVVSFGGQEIYCNGETVWNYNPTQERVVINSFDEQFSTFTIDRFLYEIPKNSEISFAEKAGNYSGVILKPKDDEQFSKIVIYTDNDFDIIRIKLSDQGGAEYDIKLSGIKYNIGLASDYFNYSPKEGIKVIDFR